MEKKVLKKTKRQGNFKKNYKNYKNHQFAMKASKHFQIYAYSVTVNMMCQLDWAKGCTGGW